MSDVRFEAVEKAYGDFVAVRGVGLHVRPGEFLTLLGPSGCGKTTCLRLVAGFIAPSRGRILMGGRDVTALPPHRRNTGMVFQSYALFPHRTVAENIAFGLEVRRLSRTERDARVADALRLVRLERLVDSYPAQLSGGQRQRVALARAVVIKPDVLLLDEPLTALDRKLREETRVELVRIQERVGITFLMVTHDQEEAMSMATRVAVMNQGRIAQIGAPRDVYESPANRFVADFLGAVNLFDGVVVAQNGAVVRIDSSEAGAPLAVAQKATPGSTVAVAVRPEKIALGLSPPEGAATVLAGTVESVSYRGEASTYRVALSTGKLVRVTLANKAREAGEFRAGARVFLSWRADAALVLEE